MRFLRKKGPEVQDVSGSQGLQDKRPRSQEGTRKADVIPPEKILCVPGVRKAQEHSQEKIILTDPLIIIHVRIGPGFLQEDVGTFFRQAC